MPLNSFFKKCLFKTYQRIDEQKVINYQSSQSIHVGNLKYSFVQISELKDVEKYIFILGEDKYFQFKVTKLDSGNNDLRVVQIIDVSNQILYNQQKAQNEFL
jgi:hypothetical protein